jgi:hypothetical protein
VNAEERMRQMLYDPATPYWVKTVLRTMWQQDLVDAANALEVISELAVQRADEIVCRRDLWE